MVHYSPEQIQELSKYVSNPTGDIFVVRMPGLVGAIYARYSRAPGGFRDILLKEFIEEGKTNSKKAQNFIEKVLVNFGDESVGELEGTHLSLEKISNLATKEIEDRRIGGSPIEQSSRYVVYDQLDEQGRFRYYCDPLIIASSLGKEFVDGMDAVFRCYTGLVEPMKEFFKKIKPIQEAEYAIKPKDQTKYRLSELADPDDIRAFKTTYGFDIKSKACDTIRCLLPAATTTNVGIYGNGRFFQNMLTHLYSHDLAEMHDIAARAHAELNTEIPVFVKRAERSQYLVETRRNMWEVARRVIENNHPESNLERVVLLENEGDKGYVDNMVAQMLFPFTTLSLQALRKRVRSFPESQKQHIINTYIGNRRTRFDRSGRGLEFGYPFTFNLIGNFGMYRDLHRHRMLTQERQLLTTELGFDIPQNIIEAGHGEKVQECINTSKNLWEKLANDLSPEIAQYAVLFGFNIQWTMGMNLREAQHMLELRTGPQGHPDYRKMCQDMNALVTERFPGIKPATGFVNYNDYFWSRAESEARQRQKERQLAQKEGE